MEQVLCSVYKKMNKIPMNTHSHGGDTMHTLKNLCEDRMKNNMGHLLRTNFSNKCKLYAVLHLYGYKKSG